MAGNDFIGHQPFNIYWSPDNETVLYKWQRIGNHIPYQYSTKISEKKNNLVPINVAHFLPTDGYETNDTKTAFYFEKFDKLFYFDKNNQSKLIYQSTSPFRIQKVINNEKIVIRQQGHFFLINHKLGQTKQLIQFTASNTKDRPDNFLERQQIELFDYIKTEQKDQEIKKIEDSINLSLQIPIYKTNAQVGLFEVDNNLSFSIFRTDQYENNKTTHIEKWITKSGHTESKSARPKVGSKNPKHHLIWMDLNTHEHDTIDNSNLPGIHNLPSYLSIYDKNIDLKSNFPKAVIYTKIKMNPKGNLALIEVKSYDNKDRWITVFDISTRQLTCIDHQHDSAWIGGPGISGWNRIPGNIGWMPDNETVYFQSEKTGYSQLYSHHIGKNETIALTQGKFEIYSLELSVKGPYFYIIANKNNPGSRHFFQFNYETKKWKTLLDFPGNYQVTLSPKENQLAYRFSSSNKPWELYISDLNGTTKQITYSTTKKFRSYRWRVPKMIQFKNNENITVHARLFKPKQGTENGAAIQFVHGAGYLQNAHNWWSAYYREYMFHNLLADMGYTILDIDYSASEGYGRDFRTSIYRHMGGQDLDDQISGRQYLIDSHNIDPKKVGIYGGSYGGFITIMALLKYPGYFQCGAAIRSVTDWAHYNHAYTSNILNTPKTDSIAFRRSSPIYFAENLTDELLILHGMVDDNVQFQDVVRLNQRFIELGKKSFSMALYPVEPHGFIKTSSWVDEYTRILNLFEENLN